MLYNLLYLKVRKRYRGDHTSSPLITLWPLQLYRTRQNWKERKWQNQLHIWAWLMAGTGLFWEKSTVGWWLISQANRAVRVAPYYYITFFRSSAAGGVGVRWLPVFNHATTATIRTSDRIYGVHTTSWERWVDDRPTSSQNSGRRGVRQTPTHHRVHSTWWPVS
jgi:hypothetical protein